MKLLVRATVSLLGLCLCGMAEGQSTPAASLLILSKRDHTLSIVDASGLNATGLRVVAQVPVGNDPHEVIASTDGTVAYVSNYGFGAYHTLARVDLVGRKALPEIDLGVLHGPHGLTFVEGKVWFTAEGAKVIARYDPATQAVDWILGTGQNRTHMIYVSGDARHLVATNVNSGTVSIFDQEPVRMPSPPPGYVPPPGGGGAPPWAGMPRTDWSQTVVRVGNGSEGFDVSPDGREIWVANALDGTISVVDLEGKRVVETLEANVPAANRLKFTPDGKRVLVSSGPELVVLDAASRKTMKRIAVGHGSAGILVQPDGVRAFVACGPDNYVAVVDLATLAVTGHIEAGHDPDGLAWAVRR